METLRYRAIWLSDIHLGTRDAKTEYLYDFLRHTESDYLYLVGDIIDMWKLKSRWYWPRINNDIMRLVMKKARKGTRVIYIPGNHDELLRDFSDHLFGGIEMMEEAVHETADGRRLLVLHGDVFDCVVMNSRWLAELGSWAYDMLLRLNRWYNVVRRRLGFHYWSLSQYLKHKVKEAVSYIGDYEQAVVKAARDKGAHGVICGHIHHATITRYGDMLYANSGDWVESCTALAEREDGELTLIHWVTDSARLLDELQSHENIDSDGRVVPAG